MSSCDGNQVISLRLLLHQTLFHQQALPVKLFCLLHIMKTEVTLGLVFNGPTIGLDWIGFTLLAYKKYFRFGISQCIGLIFLQGVWVVCPLHFLIFNGFFWPAECWWIPQCFPLSFLEGCPLLPGQRVTIYRSSLLSLWITGHSRHSSSSPYLYIYVVEQSIQGERAPVRPWWILMDMLQWMKRGFYELKYCSWDLYLVDLYSFIGPVGRSYIHWTFS